MISVGFLLVESVGRSCLLIPHLFNLRISFGDRDENKLDSPATTSAEWMISLVHDASLPKSSAKKLHPGSLTAKAPEK